MIDEYNRAKKIIEENKNVVDDFGGASDTLIQAAQVELNLQFPKDYKLFLSSFGALTFGSIEIYGVFREDFKNSGVPDTVWATLNERKLVNMPSHLVILYNTGMGEMYCLNYKELNENNEPKITSYFPGFPEGSQNNEVLYNDFGEFLLDMVANEIS
ncbi:SMI1/KNR4 family protein [Enterococcus mundtii]|uniref:SMI1/KNR4 family protein n=1 Tax=Enterococcus TaxID=1350 RepID=UPI0008E2FB75|nr:SMI1/KNR4 family protein [Enterococcus mundtii]SFM18200.1 SMI1-KNR4 cell-wall [Enterococcus mundtii]